MLEHGGNLRDAAARFGRPHADWLDLSAGLNPHWYPAPALTGNAWHRLPEPDPSLSAAACAYYRAPRMLAVAGTQAAIQALPMLRAPSRIVVSSPSYAEHAHHWSKHGHSMCELPYDALEAAVPDCDVMVVCNPNNPTGATIGRDRLLDWADALGARGGWLVVDEAFADMKPENSVAAETDRAGLIVLRSVGKFFGLAGVRVGFVAARKDLLERLAGMLGPWTVSGPGQEVCAAALRDVGWHALTQRRLAQDCLRLRDLLHFNGIASHGTALFQWWPEQRPEDFWQHMAERGIWVRLFRDKARGIRLGLPPSEEGWRRLAAALDDWTNT